MMVLIVVLAMLAAAPVLSLPSGDLPGTGSTSDLVPVNQPGQVSARSMRAALGTRKEGTVTQTSVAGAKSAKAGSSSKSASIANTKRAADEELTQVTSRAAGKKDSKKSDGLLGGDSSGKLINSVGQLVTTFVQGLSDVLAGESELVGGDSLVARVVQSLGDKQKDNSSGKKKGSSRGAKADADSQRGLVSSVTDTVNGLTETDVEKILEKLALVISTLGNQKARSVDENDDGFMSSEVQEAKSAGNSKESR